ncbi:MAG: FliH/SctL family protein [Acidimicrobiia bacterium]
MSSSSDKKRGKLLRAGATGNVALAALEFEAMVPDTSGVGIAVDPRLIENSQRIGRQQGYDAGYEEGFARGRDEGMDAARRRIAETEQQADAQVQELHTVVVGLVSAMERAVNDIVETRENGLRGLDQAIVDGALQLAEVFLERELRNPELRAQEALSRALAMAPDREALTARLNPIDCEVLEMLEPPMSERITFRGDPALQPGDCVIEFSQGEVDARIASAIARARAAIGIDAE